MISFSSFTTPVSSAMTVLAILNVEAGTKRLPALAIDQREVIRCHVVEHKRAREAVLGEDSLEVRPLRRACSRWVAAACHHGNGADGKTKRRAARQAVKRSGHLQMTPVCELRGLRLGGVAAGVTLPSGRPANR